MNLIEEIARGARDGLSKAEIVVRLAVEHAVEVSEDWVHKIMSADGFSAAVEQAKRAAGDVEPQRAAEPAVATTKVADSGVKVKE